MKVYSPLPNKKVSDYVQRILIIENFQVTNPVVIPLYANGTPTLLFQTSKGQINGNSNYLTLFGQTVFPEMLRLEDSCTLIAYFFEPYSLYSLFGISPQELTDNPINLNLLEHSRALQLQEQLLNAPSTAAMLKLIDDYVFSLITKIKSTVQLIKFATTKIVENSSKAALKDVQNELCVTERTFQRIFDKYIGIPPNQFRKVCQFHAAFQQLQERRFAKLSDIALEHGYFDQSHFINSFKEFTSITPKEYLKLMEPPLTPDGLYAFDPPSNDK